MTEEDQTKRVKVSIFSEFARWQLSVTAFILRLDINLFITHAIQLRFCTLSSSGDWKEISSHDLRTRLHPCLFMSGLKGLY